MNEIGAVLGLLLVMAILLGLAQKLKIAYPIFLVIGGLVIGLVAWGLHVKTIELEPELVFLLFLPPIIQYAAFFTPIRDFKYNARPIGLLAVGLVIFTTVLVGVITHFMIGLPWAVAFVLGAIIAPPDAIAATSVTSRLKVPRRIVTVLEGESLVNDATALTALALAINAVNTDSFSPLEAATRFVITAVGGVIVGLVLGWLVMKLLAVLNDTSVVILVSFLIGYGAYLLSEQVLHVSGVLADVALGLYIGRVWRRDMKILSAQSRVQVEMFWESVISLFNGIVFVLIGLQLPSVLEKVVKESTPLTLFWYAVITSLSVILLRLIWVYPATYIPRWLIRKIRERDPSPPLSYPTIIGWAGMRGVVSLAAALSLPEFIKDGVPFPERDLVIFLTFCVILATLVLQGLSLPSIIRLVRVPTDGSAEREEAKARWVAAKAGRARLDTLAQTDEINAELMNDLVQHYEERVERFSARYLGEANDGAEKLAATYLQLQDDLLDAEYKAVVELRDKGVINDEILHRVQRELDLERIRLLSSGVTSN